MSAEAESWAPQACTLPTTERPLRIAEFDELFAYAVLGVRRQDRRCCQWTSILRPASPRGSLRLDVTVPAGHVDVLDALSARAEGMSS